MNRALFCLIVLAFSMPAFANSLGTLMTLQPQGRELETLGHNPRLQPPTSLLFRDGIQRPVRFIGFQSSIYYSSSIVSMMILNDQRTNGTRTTWLS